MFHRGSMNRVGIAVLGCALLLLSGCVTHSRPPDGGLTRAEEAEYAEVLGDSVSITYVSSAGWGTVIAGCMNAAGYPEYVGSGPSISNGTSVIGGDIQQQLELNLCLQQYPILPDLSGSINLAQLDYLYDYYRDFLVPCLATAGYLSPVAAPTREQFVAFSAESRWTPFYGLPPRWREDSLLLDRCPASPFAENVKF